MPTCPAEVRCNCNRAAWLPTLFREPLLGDPHRALGPRPRVRVLRGGPWPLVGAAETPNRFVVAFVCFGSCVLYSRNLSSVSVLGIKS